MKLNTLFEGKAFSQALAGESITDAMKEKYDSEKNEFIALTHDDLYEYAKIIADKVKHNLENGHQ